jgi:hypothetical protein
MSTWCRPIVASDVEAEIWRSSIFISLAIFLMSEHEHRHGVKIFIDQQAYHSPNPTTGAALYALGNVQPGMELFAR